MTHDDAEDRLIDYAAIGRKYRTRISCTKSERGLDDHHLGELALARTFGYDWTSRRHNDKGFKGPMSLESIAGVLEAIGIPSEMKRQAAAELVQNCPWPNAYWEMGEKGYTLKRSVYGKIPIQEPAYQF